MATSSGYVCEFIDSVPDDFYCKKCNLVARKLTICSQCTENYCYACITDTQKQGQPCPTCGEEHFQTLPHVKYQKRMGELRVYCSLKERGCGWSGTLEQMDAHLDHDQDNCQYVDTNCPLHCNQTVPKNKVEQHVSEECVNRDYFCQYCSFKASYEEVVDKHLPECKYVPLDCPNMCGVTFERDFMEDHMKICQLEEIECEFSGVGCEERIKREDQEEHTIQNSQKHLILTASLAKQHQQKLEQHDNHHKDEARKMEEKEEKMKEQNIKIEEQEEKMKEQNKKMEEQEEKMKDQNKKIEEQEKKIKKQEGKIEEQESKIKEQEKLIQDMRKLVKEEQEQRMKEYHGQLIELHFKFQELEKFLKETRVKSDQNEAKHNDIVKALHLQRTFEMRNYSTEIKNDWTSPAMYTYVCGYKFCLSVYLYGYDLRVQICSMPGEFDGHLNWPVRAKFTIELIKQGGNNEEKTTNEGAWSKPIQVTRTDIYCDLLHHSMICDFLVNDSLHFNVANIEFL